MNNIQVSIIVPVHNGERYLKQCLDSILAQTFSAYELIIINDGSTDHTQTIIEEYAANFSCIRPYHQENSGIQITRARGLELAKGDYIAWVDADDFIEPNMIEHMYTTALTAKAEVVLCNYDFYPQKIKTKEKWFKEYKGIVDWHFIERNTQQWNKLIARSLLERINMAYWFGYCGEGAYALAFMKANGIVSVPAVLYHYRVGHASISTTLNATWHIGDVLRTERQREMIHENGLAGQWDEYYQYRIIYSVLRAMIVLARLGKAKEYGEQKKKLKELRWNKNSYTKKILDHNHGKIKSLVLRRIIPLNYHIARIVTKVALR